MVLSGKWLFVERALMLLIYKFVRFHFNILQAGIWHLTGTAQKAADAKKPENYDRCAHVVNIKRWFKFELFAMITMHDFIYTHNRFVSPRYIFDNDDVTLLTITDEFAVFAENREKGTRLWRSECNPFMRLAQLDRCDKLILVPRDAFHRMSEELGDIRARLVLLFSTGRCGSTLLTQMLECTEQCVTISEPGASLYLDAMYSAKGNTAENRELLRDALRWDCRPYKDFKPLSYCVKFMSHSVVSMRMYKETFPECKCVFMYREPLKVAKSFYKMLSQSAAAQLCTFLNRYSIEASNKFLQAVGLSVTNFKMEIVDAYSVGLSFVIQTSRVYLDLLDEGFEVVGVRYEDIISDPTFAFKKILEYIGMPDNLVALGVKAMEQDSQRNSPLSTEILGRHKEADHITPRSREQANSLMKKNGLPILGEDTLLPATITCKK